MQDFLLQPFFQYLSKWQKNLVRTSYLLLEREQKLPYFKFVECKPEDEACVREPMGDYSFIVFPMAKAYEGFLKKYLFDLGLISQHTYEGKRFRIGRALNPDIYENHRDEYWLYDDVVKRCGKDTAQALWNTWLTCRNRVFHFFPKEKGYLSLAQAEKRLDMIKNAMSKAINCINND